MVELVKKSFHCKDSWTSHLGTLKRQKEEEEDITYIGNGAVQRIRKSLALKRTYIIVHQFI